MAETTKRARSASWGSIRTLPSGRYQARYIGPDGQRHSAKTDAGVAITFTTKMDARAWLAKEHSSIVDGSWVSPSARAARHERAAENAKAQRFATYAETWVAERRNRKGMPLAKKTMHEYRQQIKSGLSPFADRSLQEITPAYVRSWHASRAAVAPTSAGAEARLLRAIMNTALVDEIITKNPVESSLGMSSTGIAHRPPTLEELTVMLNTIDRRFRLAIILGAYGGLRISEWRALRRCDLTKDGNRYLVDVHRQAQHIGGEWVMTSPKSTEGERVVPLPTAATTAVESHLETFVGKATGALLFAPRGNSEYLHDRQFNDPWNIARDAAGVRRPILDEDGKPTGKHVADVREHDLRAFAGTMHAQSGATLRETMAFLGHSTTVAAMAYQKTTGRGAELADRMPFPAT